MDGTLETVINRIAENARLKGYESSKKTCDGQTSIKSVRGTYNLLPEELEAHKNEIIRIEAEREKCANCKGICHHAGSAKGMTPVVTHEGGYFHSGVTICKWEKMHRKQVRTERLFRLARIPRAYAKDRWEDYTITKDNERALAAAKWATTEDNTDGLFIYGPRGTGKTKLAAIIANEKTHGGQEVLFASVPDLLEDIRQSFRANMSTEVMKAARETPCLILDDLGAEHITEWVGEQLFSLLNYRYNERLQTIITTNYSTDELADRLTVYDRAGRADDTQAQRILSRVYGMCRRVYLGGKDWRQSEGAR